MKVERVSFLTFILSHLEGMCRYVMGVIILDRGDEVVTVARALHCEGTNRDKNCNEVENGRKEKARGVFIQCIA